jgi:hypothetical protein
LIGIRLRPSPDLQIDISNQYGVDTFNTVYAKANYRYPLNDDWAIRLGAEFTDQRAVGAALVANAADKKWVTQVGGARVQLIYRQLTLTGAFSITGSGNNIQNPWGTYPGFLSLIDAPAAQNFARANEKAWLIGAVYDFSALGMAGLVGILNFASGMGAIDPKTRMKMPDQKNSTSRSSTGPWASTILRGLIHRARCVLRSGGQPWARSSDPRDPRLGVGHSCSHRWHSREVADSRLMIQRRSCHSRVHRGGQPSNCGVVKGHAVRIRGET